MPYPLDYVFVNGAQKHDVLTTGGDIIDDIFANTEHVYSNLLRLILPSPSSATAINLKNFIDANNPLNRTRVEILNPAGITQPTVATGNLAGFRYIKFINEGDINGSYPSSHGLSLTSPIILENLGTIRGAGGSGGTGGAGGSGGEGGAGGKGGKGADGTAGVNGADQFCSGGDTAPQFTDMAGFFSGTITSSCGHVLNFNGVCDGNIGNVTLNGVAHAAVANVTGATTLNINTNMGVIEVYVMFGDGAMGAPGSWIVRFDPPAPCVGGIGGVKGIGGDGGLGGAGGSGGSGGWSGGTGGSGQSFSSARTNGTAGGGGGNTGVAGSNGVLGNWGSSGGAGGASPCGGLPGASGFSGNRGGEGGTGGNGGVGGNRGSGGNGGTWATSGTGGLRGASGTSGTAGATGGTGQGIGGLAGVGGSVPTAGGGGNWGASGGGAGRAISGSGNLLAGSVNGTTVGTVA